MTKSACFWSRWKCQHCSTKLSLQQPKPDRPRCAGSLTLWNNKFGPNPENAGWTKSWAKKVWVREHGKRARKAINYRHHRRLMAQFGCVLVNVLTLGEENLIQETHVVKESLEIKDTISSLREKTEFAVSDEAIFVVFVNKSAKCYLNVKISELLTTLIMMFDASCNASLELSKYTLSIK